ncbi:MAG: methionyl-tRNA formyltransferase, partial [Bacilli bacterium]|nr:methionyl-tRNA formyltransferase [Bacilli bacterium]
MKDLKVVFMGTPNFAVPVLKELIENTNVVLVVTKEDKEVGRKKVLTPTPVAVLAEKHGIEVFKPHRLKNDYQIIIDKKPDIIITCAYGQIVPVSVLECPPLGCINVHASLLPKYRGASPITAAIMNGEEKTGITIMYMAEGIDTGNIIQAAEMPIEKSDTCGTLSEKLSNLGAELLMKTLPSIIDETNFSLAQDAEEATYVGLLKREDERLDFNDTVQNVVNKVRALNPEPLANILIDGEEWKILSAEIGSSKQGEIGIISEIGKDYFSINCQDGCVNIKEIKPFGKKNMLVRDFLNG